MMIIVSRCQDELGRLRRAVHLFLHLHIIRADWEVAVSRGSGAIRLIAANCERKHRRLGSHHRRGTKLGKCDDVNHPRDVVAQASAQHLALVGDDVLHSCQHRFGVNALDRPLGILHEIQEAAPAQLFAANRTWRRRKGERRCTTGRYATKAARRTRELRVVHDNASSAST